MGFFDPVAGFAVTLRQIFKRKVTTQYPEHKRTKPQRFHGRHVLNRYPDGMEKCIGCELCAGVCPARCIYVRGADNPVDDPVSPGERFGFVYEINMLRCIFCGLCVEACPTEAITMTHLFEMSVGDRQDAIYTKSELVMDPDGSAITHLQMREGHLWGKKDVAIPVSAISLVDTDTIYLKIDKGDVQALPDIHVRREVASSG